MRSPTITAVAVLLWGVFFAAPAFGQAADASPKLPMSELEQVVAPIALYPDPLIALILPASTNPLQVVEAARYAAKNPGKKEPPAGATWDAPVVGLLEFPDVLKKLDEDPGWTQRLGDLVVSQQADVMKAIQNLRLRCQQAGQLATTPQQKVVVEQQTVKIVPADPQVIYVPTYNPATVVAPPPPPPPGPSGQVLGGLLTFGAGVALGAAIEHNNDCVDWHGGSIYPGNVNVNVNRTANVNQTTINQANVNRANVNQANVNRTANTKQAWQPTPQAKAQVQTRQQAKARTGAAGAGVQPVGATDANRRAQANVRAQDNARKTQDNVRAQDTARRTQADGRKAEPGKATVQPVSAAKSDGAFSGAKDGGAAARQQSARGQSSRSDAAGKDRESRSGKRDAGSARDSGGSKSRDRGGR